MAGQYPESRTGGDHVWRINSILQRCHITIKIRFAFISTIQSHCRLTRCCSNATSVGRATAARAVSIATKSKRNLFVKCLAPLCHAFIAGVTPRDDLVISLADELAEIDRHNAEVDQQITSVKSELESLDRNQPESAQRIE